MGIPFAHPLTIPATDGRSTRGARPWRAPNREPPCESPRAPGGRGRGVGGWVRKRGWVREGVCVCGGGGGDSVRASVFSHK